MNSAMSDAVRRQPVAIAPCEDLVERAGDRSGECECEVDTGDVIARFAFSRSGYDGRRGLDASPVAFSEVLTSLASMLNACCWPVP